MDPATIESLISAAQEYFASREEDKWKHDVSKKLDEISNKLSIIIDTLYKLRVWIAEDTKATMVNIFVDRLTAERHEIELHALDIKNGTASTNDVELVKSHGKDLLVSMDVISNWSHYGFTHYPALIAGYITIFYYMSIIKTGPEFISAKKRQYIEYLTKAIDVNEQKSIAFAHNAICLAASSDLNWLRQYTNKRYTVSFGFNIFDENGNQLNESNIYFKYDILTIDFELDGKITYTRKLYQIPMSENVATLEEKSLISELASVPYFMGWGAWAPGDSWDFDENKGNYITDFKIRPYLEPVRQRYAGGVQSRDELQKHLDILNFAIQSAPKSLAIALNAVGMDWRLMTAVPLGEIAGLLDRKLG